MRKYFCVILTKHFFTLLLKVNLKKGMYNVLILCCQGHPVVEKYFKPGTTIVLRCLVTNYRSVMSELSWISVVSVMSMVSVMSSLLMSSSFVLLF